MNPWVEMPPLHSAVKEFNDTLITSLTFRRWKSGKSYCLLLFLTKKSAFSGKEKLCRRCSLLPGYVGSQLPVFAGTTETQAHLRSSQSQLLRQNTQKFQVYTFPLSMDGLQHILMSLPDQSLLLKTSVGTVHPSWLHGFLGKASLTDPQLPRSWGCALRLHRGTGSRQGCSWDLLGLKALLKEESHPWLQQPFPPLSLDVAHLCPPHWVCTTVQLIQKGSEMNMIHSQIGPTCF